MRDCGVCRIGMARVVVNELDVRICPKCLDMHVPVGSQLSLTLRGMPDGFTVRAEVWRKTSLIEVMGGTGRLYAPISGRYEGER